MEFFSPLKMINKSKKPPLEDGENPELLPSVIELFF